MAATRCSWSPVAEKRTAIRSPCARFLGAVEDLPALFSAADVFTLPTIYDPFSNACLEAIAAGLPVVTTTANGFSEILTRGVHGDVVEPGDVTALAQRSCGMEEPGLRRDLRSLPASWQKTIRSSGMSMRRSMSSTN